VVSKVELKRAALSLRDLVSPGGQAVAMGDGEVISGDRLLQLASAIASRLPDAVPGSEVAFSFEASTVGCAAALLACWAKGHSAVLPGDGQKASIMPLLQRECNVAFVHDTGVGLGIFVTELLASAEPQPALEWTPGEPDSAVLRVVLGEPGQGSPELGWTEAELLAELDRIVDGAAFAGAEFVASCLTPTSAFGLWAGLLGPLRLGVPMGIKRLEPGAPMAPPIQRLGSCLVLAASQVRALGHGGREGQPMPYASLIHSSGGLDALTRSALGQGQVHLVAAPRMPTDRDRPALVGVLERVLLAAPEIADVAVALVPESAAKTVLIVVAAAAISESSIRELINEHMPDGSAFELRTLASLPRDSNGALPDWRVLLFFRRGRNGAPLEFDLKWVRVAQDEPGMHRFRTRMPANCAYFEGHYTGYPILAGAAQIKLLAQSCIQMVDADAKRVTGLRAIKFLNRIVPGDELDVTIQIGTKPAEFIFEILRGETRCSGGRIQYSVDGEGP
jgi:3-hydroxymyristoyl/3-hydroxydecanoyl-(acyl carrier protein) dehydratase